jgi:hypothetical protein
VSGGTVQLVVGGTVQLVVGGTIRWWLVVGGTVQLVVGGTVRLWVAPFGFGVRRCLRRDALERFDSGKKLGQPSSGVAITNMPLVLLVDRCVDQISTQNRVVR